MKKREMNVSKKVDVSAIILLCKTIRKEKVFRLNYKSASFIDTAQGGKKLRNSYYNRV